MLTCRFYIKSVWEPGHGSLDAEASKKKIGVLALHDAEV